MSSDEKRVVTKILAAIAAAVILCLMLRAVLSSAVAHADVDGSVPSPGSCPYPAIGTFGAGFGEYDYACQFPVEINGSRHTTLFGGGMWQTQATVGVSFMIFNASVSAFIPAGVLRGISYWACPDFSMAEQPNPPGAWKDWLAPKACTTLAPKPVLIRPGDEPAPPPGAPPPPPLPNSISSAPTLPPAVTNPDQPNPDQWQNPPQR